LKNLIKQQKQKTRCACGTLSHKKPKNKKQDARVGRFPTKNPKTKQNKNFN